MGNDSSSRMRIRGEHSASKFQCRDSLLARHGGKRRQELVQRVACFKVVEQILDGDPSPDEDGCAAEDFGIAMHYRLVHG